MLVTTPSDVVKLLGVNDTILILVLESSEKEGEVEKLVTLSY